VVSNSVYDASLIDGHATNGLYHKFLAHQILGKERPLETTRAKRMIKDNFETYYMIAVDALLKSCVVVANSDYDIVKPYSKIITITHHERIFSSDETTMDLDYTTGGKEKSNKNVRDGVSDRG
jgi:hypothetical protein